MVDGLTTPTVQLDSNRFCLEQGRRSRSEGQLGTEKVLGRCNGFVPVTFLELKKLTSLSESFVEDPIQDCEGK